MLGENAAVVRFTACPRRAITGHVSRSRRVSGRGRVRSVTGQRSNQLNYIPNCFSYGLSETACLLSILTVNRVSPASIKSTEYNQFSVSNRQYEKPPRTVRRLSRRPSVCPCSVLNCSGPNSDQYRLGIVRHF